MDIAPCTEDDLDLLHRHLPREVKRFDRQRDGLGTLLIARRDGIPVGSCEIKWDGCSNPEVRAAYPGCPEVNGLGVWPPVHRGQGIGTALLGAAERLAAGRGTGRIGLGVEEDNPRARDLYLRLGYRGTLRYLDRWTDEDAADGPREHADPCTFLVKPLTAPAA